MKIILKIKVKYAMMVLLQKAKKKEDLSMKLRNIIALLLVLCMAFALVACGGETESKKSNDDEEIVTEENEKEEPEAPEEDEEEVETEDTKPQVGQYIVYVKDEDGNAVAGVELKFAKDSGDSTIKTDEDGRAKLTCIVTDITVTVEEVPEGFKSTNDEFEFDDDFEITITLKAE